MEKYSFEISVAEIESMIEKENLTGIFINFEKSDEKDVRLVITGSNGRNISLKQSFYVLRPIGATESDLNE